MKQEIVRLASEWLQLRQSLMTNKNRNLETFKKRIFILFSRCFHRNSTTKERTFCLFFEKR